MKLSQITNPNQYLSFPYYEIHYKPIVALSFPPGMLAIAAAINAVLERLEEDIEDCTTDDFSFIIEWYKEEIEKVWELQIVAQDDYLDHSRTFDIQVVREGNDYNAKIISKEN